MPTVMVARRRTQRTKIITQLGTHDIGSGLRHQIKKQSTPRAARRLEHSAHQVHATNASKFSVLRALHSHLKQTDVCRDAVCIQQSNARRCNTKADVMKSIFFRLTTQSPRSPIANQGRGHKKQRPTSPKIAREQTMPTNKETQGRLII